MATPFVRIEDIVGQLGYTRSTVYRYLMELAGVAVPILRPDDGRLVGNLAQTLTADQTKDVTVRRCAVKLREMAGKIVARYVDGLGRLLKTE